MPELPEVETAKRQLNVVCGSTISKVIVTKDVKLRIPVPSVALKKLVGKTVTEIKRRGKYIFLHCGSKFLVCHFGMTGMIFLNRQTPHLIFKLVFDDGSYIAYCDTRRFGAVHVINDADVKDFIINTGVGVEPLTKNFNSAYLKDLLAAYKMPIKEFLLNQGFIAGIGNIYASEVCFAAKLSPFRPANECLSKSKLLVKVIKRILRAAIENGGSTVNSYSTPNGEQGHAQFSHKVYGKASTKCECGAYITKANQKGRSTFYCARCQR